ncbi:hypothetical protein MSAN_01250100 [Mycena sanguinolenta]|uniref:Aminoglycoside phosphotransferase domain-containing protein n=1 Tax=Mycena sanguinolenta TaxID=230812 RepID=A0A8H6YJJ6_9AGAR|nr:hypothetical protein MSAN_01250100 [Mycena sanguinolenta]
MTPHSPSCSQSPTRLQLEMTDIELAAFEAHIVAICADHMQSYWRDKGYRACPIGGGLIRHRFFKDHTAPLAFSSVAALERYMNKGRKLLSKLATPADPIVITDDPLIFTQSDMHVSNFGVDECGNTVLMDFGLIGRLPLSFAKYTIQSSDDFISRVADLLHWPENSNIDSMARVSHCLWMTANPQPGLNNDGLPAPKRSKREGTGV